MRLFTEPLCCRRIGLLTFCRWSAVTNFSSSARGAAQQPIKRLTDEEEDAHVSPRLKAFFNRKSIAMQTPNMSRKYATSKAPLVPGFFMGRLELELLEFPELSTKEEVTAVDALNDRMEDFMMSFDSGKIDRQSSIPEPVLKECAQIGLFGQRLDSDYGGLGMNALESTRIAESMGLDASIFATITAHEALGMKGLLLAGSLEQKQKYLPSLSSGEKIAAFCLSEASSGADPQPIQSRAKLSADGKYYILNGKKIWVTNGSRASLFTVIAKTAITNGKGDEEDKMTAFLVERDFGGVVSTDSEETLGLRGLDLTNVIYTDVRIPVENVLGQPGDGLEIATKIAGTDRYLVGGFCVGMLRNVIDAITEHCQLRHQFGRPLGHFEMVQERLARAASHLYALESMTYLVSGLITAQPERDLRIESAVVKLFATETTKLVLNECMTLAGATGLTQKIPIERYLRDTYALSYFMGSNDLLRLYIAGSGLSVAGNAMQDFVRKARNPLAHLKFMLRQMFLKDVRKHMQSPAVGAMSGGSGETERGVRASMHISDHLHPNLRRQADRLSRIVYHTHEMTRQAFILHGNTVIENQLVLRCLADLATDIFAVTASLSRASRAKSIGVRYHDNEIELTEKFSTDAFARMESILAEYKKKENLSKRIASLMFKENGYPIMHPLTRVW